MKFIKKEKNYFLVVTQQMQQSRNTQYRLVKKSVTWSDTAEKASGSMCQKKCDKRCHKNEDGTHKKVCTEGLPILPDPHSHSLFSDYHMSQKVC